MKAKTFWKFRAQGERRGELLLYGEISDYTWWGDEVTPKQFKADLDALGAIDRLDVFINSPGGDVFAGQAIYSMLKRYKAEVYVYVDGLAASIASLVAMAGDKVIMPKNAMMMVHSPWTIAMGNAQEFRRLADDMDKIRDSMIGAYAERSELTNDEVVELLDAETWLSAQDCLEYGFCDELEESKQLAACADAGYYSRYHHTPPELLAQKDNTLLKRKLLLELEL